MNSYTKNFLRFKLTIITLFVALLGLFGGCDKNSDPDFKADFTYTLTNSNNVEYVNASVGEYYSLIWNFGNGSGDTTTNKKESYSIYYPVAGDYDVSLRLTDYNGNSTSVSKTVTIASTEIQLSFSMEIDAENPNYVNLINTSTGEYDSFSWLFRDEVIEDEMEYTAYFPFEGNYEIELVVMIGDQSFSHSEFVNILQDDPNYIPNLTLVWSDEFDGSSVNSNNWTFETGSSGWGNQELQNYTNGNNTEVVDGNLIITAKKINDNTTVGSYTSARMVTIGKQEFTYGKMEIRAKLPSGRGVWPAIWMLGSDISSIGWPACGEMDIMEYVGYQPDIVHSTVHTTSGSGGSGSGSSMSLPTCEEEFHVYGLLWTEEKLVFYVDDIDNVVHTYAPAVKTAENWPFNKPAFFILNIAVGGTWGGLQGIDNSIFPQSMLIDYVRVYQEVK
jgi:beta-glucanase (GH16 family)